MADINRDSHTTSSAKEEIAEKQEPETGIAESDCKSDASNKEEHQNKAFGKIQESRLGKIPESSGFVAVDDDADNKGAYTAGTRGFPPSRLTPRAGVFGGSPHAGSNPFAARSCMSKSSLDGGQSSDSTSSLWPGLTPSKLGGAVGNPSVATPPRAGESTPTRSTFPLNPPRLGNPFSKASPQTTEGEEAADKGSKSEEPATPTSTVTSVAAVTPSTVRFVPLGTPNSAPQDSSSAALPSTPASFVFGQNLHERAKASPNHVAQTASTSKQSENGVAEAGSSSASSGPTTNGTTAEMLFSAGLKEQGPEANAENGEPTKSLSEAAREYEESRSAVKRKYEQVTVRTGEEDETNVLQERGHGQLRLNDKVESRAGGSSPGGLQSRIIMRTFGSLRVVLNTKVWAAMVVDRASPGSLRITAMDNDKIKVFLIKTSVKEAESLHTALERRVASQRQRAPQGSCESGSDASSSSQHQSEVEEARRGVETSTLPPSEPSSKKGRSSDASADSSGTSDEGPDLEL
ncbi:hypothetical protein B566_EDAN008265 [Ephemera danica]|nr:hypothetical protein B566_EDAN008265 [Ephemera danica]